MYERTNFEGPNGEPKFLRSFVIDVFLYPPPFLLLSRLGLALSEDFAVWRAVWFGMEGAIVAAGLLGRRDVPSAAAPGIARFSCCRWFGCRYRS